MLHSKKELVVRSYRLSKQQNHFAKKKLSDCLKLVKQLN